jgi:hypothetical protein
VLLLPLLCWKIQRTPLAACRLLLLLLPCRRQQQLFQVLQRSFKLQTLPVQFPQLLQASADFGACHQADLLLERLDSNCC